MTQTARGVHKNELVGFTRAIAFTLLAVLAYGIGAALRPGDSSVQAVPTHCIEWFCVEVSGDEDRDGDPDFGVCMAGPIPQSDWYCNANFRGVAFRGSQGLLLFLNNQTARHFSGHTSSGRDVVVISDSIPDVKRGLDNGAFMVAVASNLASRAVLAAHRPDVLPDDFTDHDLLCRLKPASDPLQRSAVRTAVPAVPE